MSIIAKLLSFTRVTRNDAKMSDVKINSGGDNNLTVEHFALPGDDSFPLITDYVLATDIPRNGGKVAHGYLDPINDPVALEGDKRIYARDPITGLSVNEVWLKNDGSILLANDNGSIELQANGDVIINGVTIDISGNITTPATIQGDTIIANTSIDAAGLELVLHDHLAGTPPGSTGPNQ